MTAEIEKIAVLIAFALVMLLVNIKAGLNWLKTVTLYAMVACLATAAWFVGVVVLS